MLYLRLFGQFAVANCDDFAPSASVALSGRMGSLLAYLALARGKFFTRSELITVLWSDQSDASIGSFNTILWRLRKALERSPLQQTSLVISDRRGAIGLPQDAALQLDIDKFSALVKPGLSKPLEALDDNLIEQLRLGVALYSDDILAGFHEDWALRARELNRRLYLNALARLMQLSSLAQDHSSAIRYAQDILDHDPLREDVHRELMRLFELSGQRAMALRQFEQCRNTLRKELAIQPMRETMAIYQKIANSAVTHDNYPQEHPFITQSETSTAHPIERTHDKHMTMLSASELISNARKYLAQADAHLQYSLPFLDDLASRAPG